MPDQHAIAEGIEYSPTKMGLDHTYCMIIFSLEGLMKFPTLNFFIFPSAVDGGRRKIRNYMLSLAQSK